MPREAQDVTEAELALLQVLWDRAVALSIRQVAEIVYPGRSTAFYPTVQKQLERLEAKGVVSRDRSLPVHLFAAAISRDELVGRRLDALTEKLCGGSLTPIVSHLLRASKLDDAQREHLRALIDAPDETPKRKSPRTPRS